MKAIWKGALTFGLVNIPVKLYAAVESSSLDFDMLDAKDHAKIRFKRVNEETGREVDWDNIVKGYYLKDRYVILDDEDFEEASPEKTKLIEIKEFVNDADISPMYYEAPYFVEPEKSGAKAYSLLRAALIKTGKAGLSTFVMRNAEILAIVKAYDDMIILHKMRFHAELRKPDDIKLPSAREVKPAELKIAIALIRQFSTTFKPEKYKNNYSNELMRIIKLKAAGKRAKVKKLPPVKSKNTDLLTQLKASLSTKKRAS